MKSKSKKKIPAYIVIEALLIVAVLFGVGYYYVGIHLDAKNSPPEITVESKSNVFSVYDDESAFLDGVSATDKEDGIVTDSLIIESVSPFVDENTRVVTYAAFDSNNNVTKLEREITYSDYTPPTFTSSSHIYVEKGDYAEILSHITAYDVIDGDISDKVKLEVNNVVKGVPGDYAVELTVTNSCGDVSAQSIVVTVTGGKVR